MTLNLPAIVTDRSHDGKATALLNDKERAFVMGMLQQGANKKAAQVAAAEAGYAEPRYGYELLRKDHILAAMREEATKRLAGAALIGVTVMLDIARDPTHKDQFRAAKELAAINGFTAEQRIVVEHIDNNSKEQIRQIREMAAALKLDPRQLIEAAGIVEGEYEEVAEAGVDTSDW